MGNFPRDIVGNNIKAVRIFLNFTQYSLATYAQISKTSLVNIETGSNNYSIQLLDKVLYVINYNWSEIISEEFIIKDNLKEELIAKHKDWNLGSVFGEQPSPANAVSFLLTSDFLNFAQTRKQIQEKLLQYGWHYPSNSITKVLSRLSSEDVLTREPDSEGMGFKYSKNLNFIDTKR